MTYLLPLALPVRTGFTGLDGLLGGGLRPPELVVVASSPGMGKTSLALNIVRNAAVMQGAHAAVFNLEMNADRVASRLLAAESGLDSTRLEARFSEREDWRLMRAVGVLGEAEIYIAEPPLWTASEMASAIRRLHNQVVLDLVVLDYIQLVRRPDGERESQPDDLEDTLNQLRVLARDLGLAVVACYALPSRSWYSPIMSDLRNCGSVEELADMVLLLHRDEEYWAEEEWQRVNPGRPFPEGIAQVIIAKHRNGPTGTVHMRFRKHLTRFEDLAVMAAEPEYE